MFWHNDRSPSKFALLISNERLNGPNKFVWFIETVVLVGTSYLLAYLVPQVRNLNFIILYFICFVDYLFVFLVVCFGFYLSILWLLFVNFSLHLGQHGMGLRWFRWMHDINLYSSSRILSACTSSSRESRHKKDFSRDFAHFGIIYVGSWSISIHFEHNFAVTAITSLWGYHDKYQFYTGWINRYW